MKLQMTKLCRQYMKEVKTLFPMRGKKENAYIKNLENSIEDCIEEARLDSMESLYDNFGTPADVLASYLSSADTEYVSKLVKKKVYVKYFFIAFIVLLLTITGIYAYHIHEDHKICESQQIFFEETVIE